ncbi:SPON1 [Symbiodinium pilosum]|uniref:SPON1 protein n=1 Tax=Symbiodinium pilosum TaxID=2952 RepID=A0A812R1B0_SYMPI|nr:SPON1 [Symbiodinium pilosum]
MLIALPFLLAQTGLSIRDFSVSDELQKENGDQLPDGYNDFFSHFHVTPETHRAVLEEHGDTAVTLAVVFALHPAASVIGLTLPPGYLLLDAPANFQPGCPQVFAPQSLDQKSAYENETQARSLTSHIISCEVDNKLDDRLSEGNESEAQQRDAVVALTLKLEPDLPGLSKKLGSPVNDSSIVPMSWWFFHIRVRYPDRSPEPQDNHFLLHWASISQQDWEGETSFQAWPILGDWNCVYSDWEGWGSCSARCGGGKRMLVRRPLQQPPAGQECNEIFHPTPGTCNEHPCLYSCGYKEEVIEGECSASCGGGVKFTRKRFYVDGDNFHLCPQMGERYSEQLEPCNTQPCRARCELSKKWEVVTPCDAACGKGHFKVMKQVLQKEIDDQSCIPEFKWLPCVRQHCTKFTVSRMVANLLPHPQERFKVLLSWNQSVETRKINIRAPLGYQFGEKDGDCKVEFHSLQPHFLSCKVSTQQNEADITFQTPLPPANVGGAQSGASKGRYELAMDVVTAACDVKKWAADPIRGVILCNENVDKLHWEISFFQFQAEANIIESAVGFTTLWKEGIPIPEDLRLKADPPLPEEPPTTTSTTTSTTETQTTTLPVTARIPHSEKGVILCMRSRDPGYCQDRIQNRSVECGWQNVCQVKE